MVPLDTLLLVPVGMVAGFLNVLAGGGSLLTLPTLIFLGLDAATANGTNRIAIVGQNLAAMINFRRKGLRDLKLGILLGIPAVAGAVAGAHIAIEINDLVFRRILSVVMLAVLPGILLRGGRARPLPEDPPSSERPRLLPVQLGLFVLIGAYGGFIQAGVGYLVIFALAVVGNLSLVRTNSIKVIVIALFMFPSLLVFMANDRVAWVPGLVLTVGNSVGGWLGSAFAISRGERWIRPVLAGAVTAMALKLMGLF